MTARLARRLALLSNGPKQFLVGATDTLLLVAAALLAMVISGGVQALEPESVSLVMGAGSAVAFLLLRVLGVHRAVTRYMGMELVERCFAAHALSALTLLAVLTLFQTPLAALEVAFLFASLGFAATLMVRVLAIRLLRKRERPKGCRTGVVIYGAGDAGSQLAAALRDGGRFEPLAFVDDARQRQGRTIQGLKVYAPEALPALKERLGFERVLLAMPTASRDRRRQILEAMDPLAVKVLVMPSLEELARGNRRVDDLREVQIEDLLDRDPVPPQPELLKARIEGKRVLITGAGGSIGSELARQALSLGARKLVLLDVSEYALYAIERELQERVEASRCEIVPVLGSVLDQALVARTLARHRIQTVYHAAAYKHVPLVEANIVSALVNNVEGTRRTAEAAVAAGVECFVLVSTDKAVRPTNVMGASKRVCELIVQALAERHPSIAMSMVRFGNVLASSGSVVPLFRQQIAAGGPITVTHPEVTRYFMTIPEAAQLVIQAGAMGRHGEVMLLEMGKPVKIRELAERMVHLSGLTVKDPDTGRGDIEIRYTGLRPGEKLFEELLIADNPLPTSHPRIFKAQEAYLPWAALEPKLQALAKAAADDQEKRAVALLETLVTGFEHQKFNRPAAEAAPPAPRIRDEAPLPVVEAAAR